MAGDFASSVPVGYSSGITDAPMAGTCPVTVTTGSMIVAM